MSDRCTPQEAVHIIRGGYLERAKDDSEGAENLEQRYKLLPSLTRRQVVERSKTLSDDALVSLTADGGLSTFVIVESNRRFLALLQQEAANTARLTAEIKQEAVRTARLTWAVMWLTLGVFLLTGVLTWRELRRDYAAPTDSSTPGAKGSSSGSVYGLPDIAAVSPGRVSPAGRT